MTNVLIIDNSQYVTGAAKSIQALTFPLTDRYGFFWAVADELSNDDLLQLYGESPYQRFRFIEISRKLSSLVRYFPQLVRNTFKLNKMIRANAISIVHVNDCFNMTGIALKLLNRRLKVIYHVRLLRTSYIGPLFGAYVKLIDSFADAIVCCSKAVAADVGPTRTKMVVIYDSVAFPTQLPPARVVRPTVKRIIYVGNIMPGKGQDLAIRAFAEVANELPEATLDFVGKFDFNEISANFKAKLEESIAQLGLGKRVTFTGYTPDVESELKKADLALNLSESESFSMVCLEVLRAGVPLIASDCGGPAEIFEHLSSGWLVPNRSYSAAADAIRALAADCHLRERFSLAGWKIAANRFNVAHNASKLNDLYDHVLTK